MTNVCMEMEKRTQVKRGQRLPLSRKCLEWLLLLSADYTISLLIWMLVTQVASVRGFYWTMYVQYHVNIILSLKYRQKSSKQRNQCRDWLSLFIPCCMLPCNLVSTSDECRLVCVFWGCSSAFEARCYCQNIKDQLLTEILFLWKEWPANLLLDFIPFKWSWPRGPLWKLNCGHISSL